jgi:4-diphosphocytidyl-2-C-methyl-D-erythritol kinase
VSAAGLPLGCLAPAKVNLGLFVGPARADGRHELVTVMQSISLADRLTLEAAPGAAADEVICSGVEDANNLALGALRAFRESFGWQAPTLRLTIRKRIPVAAGLAGGSADAAGALRLAAAAAGLPGSAQTAARLAQLAQTLGADVPAQLSPGRWLATGAGERLQGLPQPRIPFGVLVLPVAEALSTAVVYGRIDELAATRSPAGLERARADLAEALDGGASLPRGELLANDLQAAAVSLCPAIEAVLAAARGLGAEHVLVSGSGPTVVALFDGSAGPERARAAAQILAEREPAVAWAVPVGAAFASVAPPGAQQSAQIDR